jgi:hypothetical protein
MMKTTRRVAMTALAAAVLVTSALPLFAGGSSEAGKTITPDDVERLLVPICPPNAQEGRFGALWGCDMWVRNSADAPVVFSRGNPQISLPGGGLAQLDPHATQHYSGAARGAIYNVEKAYADQVHLSLRIADQNRRPVNQGTEIPIVRERDWLSKSADLLDIPTDPAVRQTLRVYDPEATGQTSVRVSVYPFYYADVEPLATAELELRGGEIQSGQWHRFPDYAEIPDLVAAFPQIATEERLRVTVEPLTPGMRFWAFITITDNATQQVTVVSPQ